MCITLPAAKSKQGNLVLYSTSIKVNHLVQPDFYSIERLDPENKAEDGYQRLLNTARAKKLANYILTGQELHDAFLPTSILLATDKDIEHDVSRNTITISKEIWPFSVVDGQHRLEGLRIAAEKDSGVLDFEVPINIAINLDKVSQMCHFLIVNTTQKGVDKAVEQRIYARLTEATGVENIPSLPKWIQVIVNRGEVAKALKIVEYLNSNEDSPWRGKIQMAHEKKGGGKTIKQGSFVTLIKKNILVANNPLYAFGDFDKEKKIFLNYWKAVCSLLDDESDTVLFKYNGVDLFCKFSIPFFNKLIGAEKDFTVNKMTEYLEICFGSMEGEYAGVGHSDWWRKGSTASGLNSGALSKVVQEMVKALHRNDMDSGIKI